MRYLIFTFLLLLSSSALKAQDTIVLRSGENIVAKILEVNESDVKYKKFTYQDGPTFIVSKSKISEIKYADGSVDKFSATQPVSEKSKTDSSGYPRNLLSFDPLALAFGNASVSYEHFGKRGKWSYRIPLSIAVFESSNNRTGLGFDAKYYPKGQGKVRYYLGPSLSGYGGYRGYFSGGLMFINGVAFQPAKAFNITIDSGAGVGHVPLHQSMVFINGFTWRAGISLGVRF